jgi:hypothetical protein
MSTRAEPIRMMLEEQAVASAGMPALKPTLPFGQLPYYGDGPLRIFQSHAMAAALFDGTP